MQNEGSRMSLVTLWLIGWAVCSVASACVFAWWMHMSKQRLGVAEVVDRPSPVRPRT